MKNVNAAALSANVGKIIRRERLRCGWKIEDLAAETGLTKNSVGSMERGRYPHRMNMLFDLLWAMDCPQSVFLEIVQADADLRLSNERLAA
ncbi:MULTISPECIES: helix-turn-helix domain-containing protein [Acetobacter]|uniref:HTH cro/C1-type domain-containing protein n=1 Tax=Acetobacter pomorum DM001 TaxID=945681 RepID=F1YR59_9PROT|nr:MULTISPECIES: helix-turn-helix domain-containing protein [Acetobacter]ATI11041.1 transcriptional regulator [Acetobacter pomorum]AXC26619.1 helix-turn-helix domain-containing protein [Acetobacter sp. JWB]EGE48719.1 Hypothetical protein APO_0384 [Acetobacter pomorum DM001]KAA8386022.1 helix-turn-helix domain-containing protein [Acetobacter sp. DmW_136]KAA8420346.1 helix-turn-helix domain-containing protein [Acetobacter pomorum]